MNNLKQILINLENAGIENEVDFRFIEEDIESGYRTVTVLRNRQFEVEYNPSEKEIKFYTTYSNQEITERYINEMFEIKEMLPLIQQALDYIYQEQTE